MERQAFSLGYLELEARGCKREVRGVDSGGGK